MQGQIRKFSTLKKDKEKLIPWYKTRLKSLIYKARGYIPKNGHIGRNSQKRRNGKKQKKQEMGKIVETRENMNKSHKKIDLQDLQMFKLKSY